jgi:hydrogenase maturation protein HypF
MKTERLRKMFDIGGVVQGVGFRPALFRLANEAGLAGSVQNRAGTVRLVLEGTSPQIDKFVEDLPNKLPPNARIDSIAPVEEHALLDSASLRGFSIMESFESDKPSVLIPADLAVCSECMAEVCDPDNRRYRYPFTTCTNCGPRYTVVNSMPYDRERTTMSKFPMCPECLKEYENPEDRRFHAETTACPVCGPKLWLEDSGGKLIEDDPIKRARPELSRGRILAVRGIGGFLLAADAFNRDTLELLRKRKNRPHKPFAVMARDLETLARYCSITPEAEETLLSPEAPIVILDIKPEAIRAGRLPMDLISPDTLTLGTMLPTSPLHKLLFMPMRDDSTPAFELLIMTSGNHRSEPTCIGNAEARERLGDIVDFFLFHDREINLRNDDSLCIMLHGAPQVWRRARGYAPNPIHLKQSLKKCVLAMGAEIKNTVTVAFDKHAVISPHVGDLETPEAIAGLEQVATALPAFLAKTPEIVAVDLHPDMHATLIGRRIAKEQGIPVVEIQHHYAHAVACFAEHGLDTGLALVFDGTGLGTDGMIWGAELLYVELGAFRRLASFAGASLPGGDAAVKQPARQLIARWNALGMQVSHEWLNRLHVTAVKANVWARQIKSGLNTPTTHAAGRVFDSFSALLGFAPEFVTYEGQPAIRLETAARSHKGNDAPPLPFSQFEKDGMMFVDFGDAFRMLADMTLIKDRETAWAMAVHHMIADAAVDMIEFGLAKTSERTVALSGGVFMNRILNDILVPRLEKLGLKVLIHRRTPPNDGCISLGQAVAAGAA